MVNQDTPPSKPRSLILDLFKGLGFLFSSLTKKQKWSLGIFVISFFVILSAFLLMLEDESPFAAPKPKVAPEEKKEPPKKPTHIKDTKTGEMIYVPYFVNEDTPQESNVIQDQKEEGAFETYVSEDIRKSPFPTHRQSKSVQPFRNPKGYPVIALIVTELGYDDTLIQRALDLPPEITLAFHTSSQTQNQTRAAFEKGHESVIQIPMEPLDYPQSDPGPGVLLTGVDATENKKRLLTFVSSLERILGVAPFQGGRFTPSMKDFFPFMGVLKQEGLVFLDLLSHPLSLTKKASHYIGTPAVQSMTSRDKFSTSTAFFQHLEERARTEKVIVAHISASPTSLKEIKAWQKTLKKRSLLLAPLSHVLMS